METTLLQSSFSVSFMLMEMLWQKGDKELAYDFYGQIAETISA
jgi:hypothetical protein